MRKGGRDRDIKIREEESGRKGGKRKRGSIKFHACDKVCINIQIYLVFNTFSMFTIAYQVSLISICHLITSDGGPTDGTVYCDISRVKTNIKQIIILCLFTSTFHYYPLLLLLPPTSFCLSVSLPPSLPPSLSPSLSLSLSLPPSLPTSMST